MNAAPIFIASPQQHGFAIVPATAIPLPVPPRAISDDEVMDAVALNAAKCGSKRYIRDLLVARHCGAGVTYSDIEAAEDYDQAVTIAQHTQGLYRMMPGGFAGQVAALLAPQLQLQAQTQQQALNQALELQAQAQQLALNQALQLQAQAQQQALNQALQLQTEAQQQALNQALQLFQQEVQGLRGLIKSTSLLQNARTFNMACSQFAQLRPLPRDDGIFPTAPTTFPLNKKEFYANRVIDCDRLIAFYGLSQDGLVDEKRTRIGEHIGIV